MLIKYMYIMIATLFIIFISISNSHSNDKNGFYVISEKKELDSAININGDIVFLGEKLNYSTNNVDIQSTNNENTVYSLLVDSASVKIIAKSHLKTYNTSV